MSAAHDAIERLAKRGVRLDYRLVVAAPKGAVDANVKHLLDRHKAAFVMALASADLRENPPTDPPDFPTLDGDGFDWRQGEQTELATLDAALAKHGFERVDTVEFDRRFVAFDPPEPSEPKPTTGEPKRKAKPTAKGTPLFPADDSRESEGP